MKKEDKLLNFYLFRIKIYEPQQPSVFDRTIRASQLLGEIIPKKPSKELRTGFIWHIGNVTTVRENGLYFALGRTTKSVIELFDEEQGNFVEADFESSPYTHVVLDLNNQVFALAKKTRLAPTALGIAKQLERLINSTEEIISSRKRIEISQIHDPEDFIKLINTAYSVTKFTTEFGEPNVWDADEDFQVPMQKYLKESNGKKGKTIISGKDLNRETIEKLTRATAATGNDAQAIIKSSSESERGIIKHLKGNPAVVYGEDVATNEGKKGILNKIIEYYKQIRNKSDTQK